MTLKKILTAGLLSLCSISIASADTLGFRAATGIWQPDSTGTFRNSGTTIDLDTDLHLPNGDDQTHTYMYLEHPIPLIPNIKVASTALSFDGTGAPGAGFTYGGLPFSNNLTTKMVLDHSDVTAYWSLLDNWLNLDLGVTARVFDGKLSITDTVTSNTFTSNIDQTVPMLYGAVGLEIPFVSDLFFGVEVNMIEYNGSTIKDHVIKFSYTTSYFIGFEAGVRSFTVELDDVNSNFANMEFTGSFANLYVHF